MSNTSAKLRFVTCEGTEPIQHIVGSCGHCQAKGINSGEHSLVYIKSKQLNNYRRKIVVKCIVCYSQYTGVVGTT